MGAKFEQLLTAFFHAFGVNFFSNFFENPIASAVKYCIIKFSKMKKIELLLNFFGIKLVFLGLPKISKLSVLQKGLLLQDWVFRLGKFLLDPKSHFLSLDKLIYRLVFFSKNYIKMYKNVDPTWIWTQAHQIGSYSLYQLSYEGLVMEMVYIWLKYI